MKKHTRVWVWHAPNMTMAPCIQQARGRVNRRLQVRGFKKLNVVFKCVGLSARTITRHAKRPCAVDLRVPVLEFRGDLQPGGLPAIVSVHVCVVVFGVCVRVCVCACAAVRTCARVSTCATTASRGPENLVRGPPLASAATRGGRRRHFILGVSSAWVGRPCSASPPACECDLLVRRDVRRDPSRGGT